MGTITASPVQAAPRRRYAKGEGDRLRRDLLVSAAELMATHGDIDSVSLRAVARHAGVSATAVYRHFDDHLDLLRASIEYCWSNFRAELFDARRSSSDPFVAFRAMGDAYTRFAMENRGQYRVLFSNRIAIDSATPDVAVSSDVGMSAFTLLVETVEEILAVSGDTRDPHFVAAQVHTSVHGIVDLCGNHPDMQWPSVSDLLDGLGVSLGLNPPGS